MGWAASVSDIRAYNGWHPIKVTGDSLTKINDTTFQTSKYPIVDFDYDDDVTDDVEVYVNGQAAQIQSVDAERGLITLASAPPSDATVTASYFFHPISDTEIKLAIAAAEAEIEAITGFKYSSETRTERHKILSGNEFQTNAPIISVSSIKIYSEGGTLIDSDPDYEVLNSELGIVRINDYRAGVLTKPYFLPFIYEVEITYLAGAQQVPDWVKHAVIKIATYNILLKLSSLMVLQEDYTQISLTFKSPEEFVKRLQHLKEEVEHIRQTLPKRGAVV